ncbi:MAG: tetratricopeptide repeat protein [Bacteroidota bacterium]
MAKQEEKEKFYENPEVLEESIDQAEEFVTQNRNIIVGVLAAIAIGVGAFFFLQNNTKQQNIEAERELFPAVFFFEKDSLNKALNGDGSTTMGLLQIMDDFSGTKAANLANFYAGASYLKQGEFQNAIEYLSAFEASDYLLDARAQSLIGDAHLELGNTDAAIKAYESAASIYPNKEFTPIYLQKLAFAYAESGNYQAASESMQQIVDDFPGAEIKRTAQKYASYYASQAGN